MCPRSAGEKPRDSRFFPHERQQDDIDEEMKLRIQLHISWPFKSHAPPPLPFTVRDLRRLRPKARGRAPPCFSRAIHGNLAARCCMRGPRFRDAAGWKFFFSPPPSRLSSFRTKRIPPNARARARISRMEVRRKKKREIARRSDGQAQARMVVCSGDGGAGAAGAGADDDGGGGGGC